MGAPAGPRSTVRLRAPAELVRVGGSAKWADFVFGEQVVTFLGVERAGLRNLRSVPWSRIVSIDTVDSPVAPPAPETH